jgi:UDP-N-acetylmuramoyl-L-alanyl-D-glutamate--2,6-diaminopimelate ligase
MKLSNLLHDVEHALQSGPDVEVTAVEYDSRRVRPGALFVAMMGGTTDGNRYIAAAIKNGAVAIATDSTQAFDNFTVRHPEISAVEVASGRRALAALAANFYDHPERKLALSGVTGTNGKTTTAFLLDAMLNHVARKTVLVGTIEYHVAGEVLPSPHTTPESRDLLELFAAGVDRHATEAVMEVSSHALKQGRVYSLAFDVAIFTNLTRDHLDYHRTMEKYFAAKRKLFDGSDYPAPRVAVINADDSYGTPMAKAARQADAQVSTYGLTSADYHATGVKMSAAGMSFELISPQGQVSINTRLTGRVNVYNLLAASAAAAARGLSLEQIAAGAAALACVPGRFQTVAVGQPFPVVVDYAHTDDALRNLIALAREFVRPNNGRVITLFGCGGDRDRTKRPLMGRAAGEGSDFVVLTSDNPRSEDPRAILDDVLPALLETHTRYAAEVDRAAAIRIALDAAQPGDIVLLAGKGHESTQVLAGRTIPFDDAEVAAEALQALGYSNPHAGVSA